MGSGTSTLGTVRPAAVSPNTRCAVLAHSPVAHERSQPRFHREAGTHQAEVRRRPNHCPAHRCSDQPWTVPEVVRQEQEPTRHEFWVQQVDSERGVETHERAQYNHTDEPEQPGTPTVHTQRCSQRGGSIVSPPP